MEGRLHGNDDVSDHPPKRTPLRAGSTRTAPSELRTGQLRWRVGPAPRYRKALVCTPKLLHSRHGKWPGHATPPTDDADIEDLPEGGALFPSPLPILKKGNSDPFGTTVVLVDPLVNDLLSFNKRYFEPFIMSMEMGRDRSASYKNKMYQTSTSALHDKRTAHANLARLAIIKASIADNKSTRAAASHFMSEAYTALRKELLSPSADFSDDLPVRVLSLLSFEVCAKNYPAAAAHAHILQDLLLKMRLSRRRIDLFLLNSTFFMDMMRSLLSWTFPIIIIEDIVPSETLAVLPTIMAQLDRLGVLPHDPPDRFADTGIPAGEMLGEFSLLLFLFRVGVIISNPEISSRVFIESTVGAWAVAWAINFQHLLQIHLSSAIALFKATGRDVPVLRRTAAIALAMLYWDYLVVGFDLIDPARAVFRQMASVWSPTKMMLTKLHECIDAIDWKLDIDAPPQLRLWLLYVCTLAERVVANIDQVKEAWRSEYNRAFVAQARRMNLVTWDDVVVVLEKYAYGYEASLLSRPWFELYLAESSLLLQQQGQFDLGLP